MYVVRWDDHTGQRHERRLDSLEDARLEAEALEKMDSVEWVEFGPT